MSFNSRLYSFRGVARLVNLSLMIAVLFFQVRSFADDIDSVLNGISDVSDNKSWVLRGKLDSKIPVLSLRPAEAMLVSSSWNIIKESKRVWAWEYDPPGRIAHYCSQECACLAQEIGSSLKVSFPNSRIYTIRTNSQNLSGNILDVQALVGNAKYQVNWDYHVALLIGNSEGKWGVIDPVIFTNVEIHSLSEWFSRFLRPNRFFILQKLSPEIIE